MGSKNAKLVEETFEDLLAINSHEQLTVKINSLIDGKKLKPNDATFLGLDYLKEKAESHFESMSSILCYAIENLWILMDEKDVLIDDNMRSRSIIYLQLISVLLPRMLEGTRYSELKDILFIRSKFAKHLKPIYNEAGEYQTFIVSSNDFNETESTDPTLSESLPYMIKALEGVVSALFKEGFTLIPIRKTSKKGGAFESESESLKNGRIPDNWIWQKINDRDPTTQIMENRITVLETLISLLSIGVSLGLHFNPATYFIATYEKKRPNFSSIFIHSLLNAALSYKENGIIPFVSHVSKGQNWLECRYSRLCSLTLSICLTREHEVDIVAVNLPKSFFVQQVIFSMKYYTKGQEKEFVTTEEDERSTSSNGFLYLIDNLVKIISEESFQNTLSHFLTAIRNNYDAKMTIMPYSMSENSIFKEILYLFSRLCRYSHRFRKAIVENKEALSLNYILIYYLVQYSSEHSVAPSSPFDIILTILMELSADKNYCFNLNQPLEESVMIDQLPVVTGSYMDLLFVSFCYFLIDSQSYQPYFDNLFAIMKNLSIHCKHLGVIASSYLLLSVKKFINPGQIVVHHQFALAAVSMMEIIDRFIVFNLQENVPFMLEILVNYTQLLKISRLKIGSMGLANALYPSSFHLLYPEEEHQVPPEAQNVTLSDEEIAKIKEYLAGLSNWYKDTISKINTLNIFKFGKSIEDNVLEKPLKEVEKDYLRSITFERKLLKHSLVGLFKPSEDSLILFNIPYRQRNVGIVYESYIWNLTTASTYPQPFLQYFKLRKFYPDLKNTDDLLIPDKLEGDPAEQNDTIKEDIDVYEMEGEEAEEEEK